MNLIERNLTLSREPQSLDPSLVTVINSIFDHLDFLSEDQSNNISLSHLKWLQLLKSKINTGCVYKKGPNIKNKNYSFSLATKDEINWDSPIPEFKNKFGLHRHCLVNLSDSSISCYLRDINSEKTPQVTQESNVTLDKSNPRLITKLSFDKPVELCITFNGGGIDYYYRIHSEDEQFTSQTFNTARRLNSKSDCNQIINNTQIVTSHLG